MCFQLPKLHVEGKKINKSKSLFIFQQEKEGMFTVSTFTAEKTEVSTSCSLVYPFPILTTNPRKHSLLAVSTLPELDPGSNPHLVQRDNTWFPQLWGTWLNLLRTQHTTHAHGSFIRLKLWGKDNSSTFQGCAAQYLTKSVRVVKMETNCWELPRRYSWNDELHT